MNVTDILGIQGITQLFPMIYTDLAQPSVKKVGQALETVFEFATIPLLFMKLANEKVKTNLQHNLEMYEKKLNNIPDDKITQVNPQIGVPILENLINITDEEVADLFTTLLQKASNRDTLNQAHPSFVQMIARLSVDEARIIKYLDDQIGIPCISILGHEKPHTSGMYRVGSETIHIFIDKANLLSFDLDLIYDENIKVYLDNFISMGVQSKTTLTPISANTSFQSIIEKYNLEQYNPMKN
jgi:hypothetical protein